MTLTIFNRVLFISILLYVATTSLSAQRCEKKKLAPREWLGSYSYSSQTTYTQLAVGDTIRMKTVVYSQYNYRIFVVGENRLGRLKYRILVPEKKFEPVVGKVIDKEVTLYERDQNGFLIYDENEEPIPIGTTTVKDTIWSRRLTTSESVIFENDNIENFYWDAKIQKTRLLIVEVIVPKSNRYFFGCVSLMVGRIPFSEIENVNSETNMTK
ncbi:MAG TPA: hypothetical protein PLS84_06815 [Salinivirgaceae bacterium]|nr:hypothetical protein [Salinivirgaceae bacterium]